MNTLSFMIYFAELSDGIKAFSITAIIGLIFLLILLPMILDIIKYDFDDIKPKVVIKWVFISLVFFSILSIFMPSKDTVYLMAASEIGEDIIKSPEMNKILQLINEKLDEQLAKKD